MEQRNIIFRVGVSGLHCRSSVELVNLRIASLQGVKAASIGPDHVLTVFADADLVSPSDIVRVLIDTGVLPEGDVTASHPVADEPPAACIVSDSAAESFAPAQVAEPAAADVGAVPPVEPSLPSAVADHDASTTWVPRDETPAGSSAPVEGEPAVETQEAAPLAPSVVLDGWAPVAEASPTPETVAQPEDGEQNAVVESIRADIEAPSVAASPRAALVQRIRVDVSDDYYPNRIEVIPGVPVDIEFSEGHGCLARVVFEEFGIDADLTDGGATVQLPGLAPGSHEFTCGMQMVHGTIVAAV